jgi:hypothetical protein
MLSPCTQPSSACLNGNLNSQPLAPVVGFSRVARRCRWRRGRSRSQKGSGSSASPGGPPRSRGGGRACHDNVGLQPFELGIVVGDQARRCAVVPAPQPAMQPLL